MQFQQSKLTFHGFIRRTAESVSVLPIIQQPRVQSTEMEIERHYQNVEREDPIPPSSQRMEEELSIEVEEEGRRLVEEEAKVQGPKPNNKKGRCGRKPKGTEKILLDILENRVYEEWLRKEVIIEAGEIKTYLYCEWCRRYEKQNTLYDGILFSIGQTLSPSFNACRLAEHCKDNKKHKEAKNLAVCRKLNLKVKPSNHNVNLVQYSQMVNLLEFLQVSLKKDLSINSIVELVKYCALKGMDLPQHYTCFNSIKEIINLMAEEYQLDVAGKIQASPFFSISIDSSTDISKTKSLCVNICYLYNLEPKWSYFDSLFLEKFDAHTITEYLIELFKRFKIDWKQKLVAFCSDGEVTLRSSQNGVYGMLKRKVGRLIGIHCVAHAFTLTHKSDLTEKFPILDELFQLTYHTYKYFNSSSKRVDQLFVAQNEIEDLMEALNLVKPAKIRWLSFFNAITRIVTIFRSLIQTLEKWKSDVAVQGLLSIYANPRSLSWMHFLADIACDIKVVTEVFQERNFNIKRAIDLLESTKSNLRRKYIENFKPGVRYTSYLSKIFIERGKTSYENIFTLNGEMKALEYETEYKRFCESFIEVIDKRFEELYNLSEYIFFDLNFLKKNLEKANLIDEAQKGIPKLLRQLNMSVTDSAQICDEYAYLVEILKQTTLPTDNIQDIYGELIAYYSEKFPLALKLMSIYRVLPLSNVECERLFSRQNRIKTKFRSLIEDNLLSSLLKASVSLYYNATENIDYIERCIVRWKEQKGRYFFDGSIIQGN